MSLQIRPMCLDNLGVAVEMALEAYRGERTLCNALPNKPNMEYIHKQLQYIIKTGTACIATEGETVVGFLAFGEAFAVHDGVYGATSPLFGYGVRHGRRDVIIGKLFQSIAAQLCERYVQSLRVNVYAHDADVLWMYIATAFAMDVTQVVKNTSTPIQGKNTNRFTYREVSKSVLVNYREDVIDLYRELVNHLRVSPVFYHCRGFLPLEDRFEDFLSEKLRVFAAFEGKNLIGIIDSEPVDIELFKNDSKALCMGDVFVKPNYRGEGVAANLLRFANGVLKNNGAERLFVTHGTINPNARGFWDKYFTNYCYTMARVVDADMLGVIERIE